MVKTKEDTQAEPEPIVGKIERKRGRVAGAVPFPRKSLKECLEVAKAIWRDNAGQPYDPIYLATTSLKTTRRSSGFEILLRSSEQYGLTSGKAKASAVSLTSLGSAIVAPTDDSRVGENLRKALLTPEIFSKIYTRYNRLNFPPRPENVKYVLEKELKVPRGDVDGCYDVIMQNISDYDLLLPSGEGKLLMLDRLGKASAVGDTESLTPDTELGGEAGMKTIEEDKPPDQPKVEQKQIPKQIFVAHGKNKKPLEQLKNILNQFKVQFQVAIDQPDKGRAISTKVIQLMKQCSSGIFIFTGDEETKDAEDNTILRPSDNVVFELGAGIMQYGDKIVIFREEGVSFGSDFTSYGHITFEKDKLDAKGLDLVKELIAQDFLEPPRPK